MKPDKFRFIAQIRFIELMPLGNSWEYDKRHYMTNTDVIERYLDLVRIACPDKTSTALKYAIPEYVGKVGLISPNSHKFCGSCNRVRLTADGRMKTCLYSDEEVDLKNCLRNNIAMEDVVRRTIFIKPVVINWK